jgi:tRNA-2-methylthio-N6-dimethylallyladenosine synthase
MTADFVPDDVAAERMERLVEVVDRHALARHRARVGGVEEVLVEGPSKKDPTVRSGRTAQNKLVHFAGDVPAGAYADVRITYAAPHWLRGELVEVTRPAARRPVRIPVTAG